MARKFGKKKEVKIDPLAYNIGLAGLSGIGKTTLIKNVCEELVGEDGYLMLDIGKESGHDCIDGIVSEECADWEKLDEVLDDIIDNRTTDYKDLKVIVFDTLDELFTIGEDETIDRWNRANPDKRTKTINSVNGGFGKGLDACIEMVLDRIWSLKEVGISFIVIVHTKTKDVEDPITGQTYQVITANMPQRYFNAIKTKLDIFGVAYIDRDIVTEKLGRKDIKGKEITRNIVSKEARKIAFRSDNYNLDSKCRFPEIVSEIDLDPHQFIQAITDAIKAEQAKSGKTFEQSEKEQAEKEAEEMKELAKKEAEKKEEKKIESVIEQIKDFIKDNKGNMEAIKPLLEFSKEHGYTNPTLIDDLAIAEQALKIVA